jgi:hypothetical protein
MLGGALSLKEVQITILAQGLAKEERCAGAK